MTSWHRSIAAACLGLAAATALAGEPLVITRGGTYQGDFTSDDPAVPVIRITTREPVVIERSTLTGRGRLIDADAGGADVVIRNVHGVALNPNVVGRCAGRFFSGDEVKRLVIEDCRLDGTGGIYVHRVAQDEAAEIVIRRNDVKNIDGRHSDGHDGYLSFNRRQRPGEKAQQAFDLVQFVQFDKVAGLPGGEIAWNRVVNEPGRSRVEDNISLYESSGRPGSPIRIHDNLIVGAYTIDPSRQSGPRDGWHEDWDYSGGGIMLGDGPGTVPSGHLSAEHNVVISTGNYGIAVAGGHAIRVDGNRVFASGTLGDGRPVRTQNVGIYVWDIAKGKRREPPTFYDVCGSNNVVGWWNAERRARNDWWVPDATTWTDNQHAASPVTLKHEADERAAWAERAAASGNSPGPK